MIVLSASCGNQRSEEVSTPGCGRVANWLYSPVDHNLNSVFLRGTWASLRSPNIFPLQTLPDHS